MQTNEIINYFKSYNPNRYDGNKTNWKYLLKNDKQMYDLLKNWYNNINEDTSVRDILFAIEHNYDKIPECAVCHKPLHIIRSGCNQAYHFPLFCSKECRRSEEGKKIEQEHYKQACEKLYGPGITNSLLATSVQEKRKMTCKLKYGTEFPLQNKDILLKTFNAKGNNLSYKDGDTYIFKHNSQYVETVYNTKKKHNTLNSSNIEKQLYNYIKDHYKFEYQYKSIQYPYVCDFYLNDLYIELQANWMHGGHPYNENDINDISILKMWEHKSEELNFKGVKKKGYISAIDTWTRRDVNKRNIAKDNNLHFLEIFSNNLNECINQINKYIKENYNF